MPLYSDNANGSRPPPLRGLRRGNGDANVKAFAASKRAGVKRSVYVSVASEVVACEESWLPFAKDEFGAYFEGKRAAEQAASDAVGGDATKQCILKPTFIYGGERFEVPLPGKFVAPRVSAAYGRGVEELLSLGPIAALADAAPGLIKVALRPPVSVEAVGTACAFAALGELTSGEATVQTCVLSKHLLASMRTTRMESLSLALDADQTTLSVTIVCNRGGVRKTYRIHVIEDAEYLKATIDAESMPVKLVLRPRGFSRLLSHFQPGQNDITIACLPETDGAERVERSFGVNANEPPPPRKNLKLTSYVDPNAPPSGALQTRGRCAASARERL